MRYQSGEPLLGEESLNSPLLNSRGNESHFSSLNLFNYFRTSK